MRPEQASETVLSTTRATAKMHEFRVDEADFIALPRNPKILFSTAIGILGDVAAAIANGLRGATTVDDIRFDLRPTGWSPETDINRSLQFASLFFDSYLNAYLDETVEADFSLLCAATYYLRGNVGSAAVITKEMTPPDIELASGLGMAMYIALRNGSTAMDFSSPLEALAISLLSALNAYRRFEGEVTPIIIAANRLRDACHRFGTARELLFGDVITAVVALKLKNSARSLVPRFSGLPADTWQAAIMRPHFPVELWPSQQRLGSAGIFSGVSAAIQMPTSAGKTRATELMIRSAFLSGRATLAVIVAPYRSLCHDIRGDLTKAFAGEPIGLSEATDSYQFDIQLDQLAAQQTVLIVTPEKLLYILRRAPELIQSIGLVIYDEGHQFEGMQRGPTYELLLTSLRMMLLPGTQVVLISAVISNAAQVASWLIGADAPVITGEGLASTTRSIAFASWQDARGRLEYVNPADPDEGEFFVPRIIEQVPLVRRDRERAERRFPEKDNSGDIALYLGLHVVSNGSVAIFCGRKDSAAKIARRAVEIFERQVQMERPLTVSDANEIDRIRALIASHLGEEADVTKATILGILTHHADTPPGVRLAIEHAMKENLARFVICTSTLAQGVNFPIKYLVITTTHQGGERIKVRDFQNLMGRAGRAGMHTESSVIFSAPDIYDDRRAPLRFKRRKWLTSKELLNPFNSEPCGSALLELFDSYQQRQPPIVQDIAPHWLDLAFAGQPQIAAIVAEAQAIQPNIGTAEFTRFLEDRARAVQSIAAFLATYLDFTSEDLGEQITALASNTLAHHLADGETRQKLVDVFHLIAASILNNADENLRVNIQKSPLPPATVAELGTWLNENIGALMAAILANQIDQVLTDIILRTTQSRILRRISNQDALPQMLAAWTNGQPYLDVLGILIATDCRIGNDNPTVEDAVAICENGFGYDLAMVAASLADLAEPLNENVYAALAWCQKRIKYGLSTPSQVAFFEAGFADRVVASALANRWPQAASRPDVRNICRTQNNAVVELLNAFPAYFKAVASELSL